MKHANYRINAFVLLLFLGIIFIFSSQTYSCGGGVVPYIPTQSGASSSTSGQLFLLEKGASVEMFDVKKLQPLFRSIVLSGNERKIKKNREKILTRNKEKAENDSTSIQENSTHSKHDENTVPVLNLHRIH